MKVCFLLLITLATILIQATIAQAEEIGLNFDLPANPVERSTASTIPATENPLTNPITNPTTNSVTTTSTTELTSHPIDSPPPSKPEEISFALPDIAPESIEVPSAPVAIAPAAPAVSSPDIFAGDSDSLVAKAVGSAEGTRTPDGYRTPAYYGHVDPGNGVWNLGSFSYQHGASSPEAADAKQLRRLRDQDAILQQQAIAVGLELTLEARLNGIDLANQSPRAALDRGGYTDRLRQGYDMGLQGSEAILWARTRAFLDPDTRRWNAPGLGNSIDRITADQERRMKAVAQAIDYQLQASAAQVNQRSP